VSLFNREGHTDGETVREKVSVCEGMITERERERERDCVFHKVR
jgi:hypothetical protein